MKKRTFLLTLIFLALPCFLTAEDKILQISFSPAEGYDNDTSFIKEEGYSDCQDAISSLEKAKKVFFIQSIPKCAIQEGEYILKVCSHESVIAEYEIINDNYVYNRTKGTFLKAPGILDKIRSVLFVEYLKSKS